MAQVRYEEATRIYPGTDIAAVDRLDLDIADGEFLVVVGPSGSGKSTALRMLAGLEFIDNGSIHIGDRDVTLVAPKERDIAMVFQNYALYPQMSVAANMGFALKQQGINKDERQRRVAEAARILDLEPYLDRKPKNLSGGQRQRVAMGRAIVREPQVFLMDEPLSNLDAKLRVQTRTQLADLQADLGVTTVYVTHDQVEAMTLGDRVAVLESGKLQQCASPREMYSRPANRFVAGFIGSPAMNLVEAEGDGARVSLGSMSIPLDGDLGQSVGSHPTVTLGVRPEHLALVSADGDGTLPGRVSVVEDLGSESFVHIDVEHRGETIQVVVRGEGESDVKRDDNVAIGLAGPIHLFGPGGERLN
ncbi:MAG: sn-glycerol-3-phosphate ABC transporter ATP-binding protein UgpC [Actinomycetota bacterium]